MDSELRNRFHPHSRPPHLVIQVDDPVLTVDSWGRVFRTLTSARDLFAVTCTNKLFKKLVEDQLVPELRFQNTLDKNLSEAIQKKFSIVFSCPFRISPFMVRSTKEWILNLLPILFELQLDQRENLEKYLAYLPSEPSFLEKSSIYLDLEPILKLTKLEVSEKIKALELTLVGKSKEVRSGKFLYTLILELIEKKEVLLASRYFKENASELYDHGGSKLKQNPYHLLWQRFQALSQLTPEISNNVATSKEKIRRDNLIKSIRKMAVVFVMAFIILGTFIHISREHPTANLVAWIGSGVVSAVLIYLHIDTFKKRDGSPYYL